MPQTTGPQEMAGNVGFCRSAVWNGPRGAVLLVSPASVHVVAVSGQSLGAGESLLALLACLAVGLALSRAPLSLWLPPSRMLVQASSVWPLSGFYGRTEAPAFLRPGLELPRCYFCYILKVKLSHQPAQTLGTDEGGAGGETASTSRWEEQ